MGIKKVCFVVSVFVLGIVGGMVLFSSNIFAQYTMLTKYNEEAMASKVPSSYGRLIAVSGIYFYFQNEDGTIYILKQRNQSEFESRVVVINRSE